MRVKPRVAAPLDAEFLPAVLWNRAYREHCRVTPGSKELTLALSRADGTVFRHRTPVLPNNSHHAGLNEFYVERLLKFLLWQKGGSRVMIAGSDALAALLKGIYSAKGRRRFDWDVIGRRVFREELTVSASDRSALPAAHDQEIRLGRHKEGCRVGFDLGGSDRKCAAMVEGETVFSEEVAWSPYFEKDPEYHYRGICDSIRRAAAHLPRVDAIGGSAAGIYVDNEPRVGSLFRGVAEADFDRHVRGLFRRVAAEWDNIPFEVANDGEVTALAGSMWLGENAVLGLAMGTSLASGYCDPHGHVTTWLNEMAFAPLDYRAGAPVDEWSGDAGCGAQYLSQQAVARLAPRAGIDLPADMPPADKLIQVQTLMAAGDERARRLYETIGVYLGYAIAHYADFYDVRHVLALGRVTSGAGGTVIVTNANRVLVTEFPELAARTRLHAPDEEFKRHGQAMAAATLPALRTAARPRHDGPRHEPTG